MGLDIGSTTVKLVLMPEPVAGEPFPEPVFAEYRRHNADVRGEVSRLLAEVDAALPGARVRGAVTGSAGLSLANLMGLSFVQEVIAETRTVQAKNPEADVIIELGGEDAKITYLHPTPEQRMNGTCAGGTGAFIDQMAQLLHTDASGLNELAAKYQTLYPIASRCGVFAKSDLQPLINQGAASEDLAASVLQAVVTQTIAGLACGRPIRGNVMFLGGPLHFLPELRRAFERTLADQVDSFTCPDDAQLYVAVGAALLAEGEPTPLTEIADRLASRRAAGTGASRMRPLFADDAELAAFRARHARATVERVGWPAPPADAQAAGVPTRYEDCFLGIDAGSTTIKAVVIDSQDRIVWEHYAGNEGDPVTAAVEILRRIHLEMPEHVRIVRSCVTGYGEGIVKAALRIDEGLVETMAHYRAAAHLNPGVTSVIDIGGQDMKYLRIRGGAIDSISVNEACSAGCGSFLQTFAQSMGQSIQEFSASALTADSPVDLGSRCTVFMNSSVKQAQKENATPGDISAGLSYSVVRNALYKVIKLRDASQLGERISVQGGTFLNDAVLRAFELLTGREVVRPDIAGLMGCFGAALTAHETYDGVPGTLMSLAELSRFGFTSETTVCKLCQNHCKLTITTFNDGQRHVSGNRCERGATQERRKTKSDMPNLYDYKYRRTFAYRRLRQGQDTRGEIGVPRVLGMYENYPLWFTILTQLGFRVMLSGRSNHELFEKGMDSIPSENVCYPAKLAHGHVQSLIDKGVRTIWFPCVFYERGLVDGADDHYNCPIVATYPEVIRNNVEAIREGEDADGAAAAEGERADGVRMLAPFLNLADPAKLAERLVEVFADWDVTLPEARKAVAAGFAEDAAFKADVRAEGRRTLEWMRENGRKGIVLAGRPYHIDPEINHGVPDVINTLGMAVLSEDSILPEPEPAPDGSSRGAADGVEHAVAGGALSRAVASIRRGLGRDKEDPQAPADWSDVTAEGLPAPTASVAVANVSPKLRVRDQWAYHSRLYRAAELVTQADDLELVQLNSFGCGVDAVTTDQVQEILESAGGVYTTLKIDEVSNLGAATIRLRSLAAASQARRRRREAGAEVGEEAADAVVDEQALDLDDQPVEVDTTAPAIAVGKEDGAALRENPAPADDGDHTLAGRVARSERSLPAATTPMFTEEMRQTHTILMPQMSPIHFRPLVPLMRRLGYKVELLESASKADLEVGLRYVNNDACFPAIMVIGQLIGAFEDGSHDPDKCVVAISQTGGMCRATNYAAMLRKGLREAGYPQIPVLAVSLQGIEENPGFKLTPTMAFKALQGVVIGDTLSTCLLRVRPYEAVPGSAQALYERWNAITCEFFEHKGRSATWGGRIGYRRLLREMVREFDALELADVPRKPRVGVVGEILVKFQPDANNHVVDVIEAEGCEAVVPGLLGFFLNGMTTAQWKADTYGIGTNTVYQKKAAVWFIEQVQAPARAALAAAGGKFDVESPIAEMAEKASEILSLGNQAGEGWLLTAEMVELIEHGTPNIVCCQPFACLPNHVVGKGMFREIRRRYPQANIVGIDYDPGASEVNQLNRIKLMISTAFMMRQDAAGDAAMRAEEARAVGAWSERSQEADESAAASGGGSVLGVGSGRAQGPLPGAAADHRERPLTGIDNTSGDGRTTRDLIADLGPVPDGTPTSPDVAAPERVGTRAGRP
ncbi:acyl-CoA dehydratase activase-related protein [Actinomyces sp. 432]|uniref:acyl-CoA dehydratase activase-related protein n=1 Tax=Actinomyces sp. 432 TaxID=2057798 RepID=UPI001F41C1D9|nr:acyl-CoA dehydratase activase-related protein [Actinomyces sp. 432]